jgi:nucleoside-diphosphate-sugar epimerase
MQTILGSGGSIGIELANVLPAYTDKIRLVSRNPKKVNPNDDLFPSDLTDKQKLVEALKGSEVAYLVAGLKYEAKTWQQQWPLVIQNTIEACKANNTKLVFFDNIYMYDPQCIPFMTEDCNINPCSKKGEVRARIAQNLMDEVKAGNLKAVIARSADFYGPGNVNSLMMLSVYQNFLKGKKANWLCALDKKHSHTFIPDSAKATAILGNDTKADNQVWHLPTAKEPPTGKQWIGAFAKEMNVQPKTQLASRMMVKILGLFNPIMKEFVEMLYQYDQDYVFDSSKFEKTFNFQPTPYTDGIKEIVKQGSLKKSH